MSELIDIHITAPASATSSNELDVSIEYLKNRGYNPIIAKSCHTKLNSEQKAYELLELLQNNEVHTIWTLRGGSGSAELLPYIEQNKKTLKQINNKKFIGFSDITALLLYFAQNYNIEAIHGPGVTQYTHDNFSADAREILDNIIRNNNADYQVPLVSLNKTAKDIKHIDFEITGGNATLINLSIANINELISKNKIILLEEVSEEPYSIRRNLHYLKQVGIFDSAKGLIFGEYNSNIRYREKNTAQANNIRYELQEFAANLKIPTWQTDSIGHGQKNFSFSYKSTYKIKQHNNQYILYST